MGLDMGKPMMAMFCDVGRANTMQKSLVRGGGMSLFSGQEQVVCE